MTDKNYQKVSEWLNQSPELDEELAARGEILLLQRNGLVPSEKWTKYNQLIDGIEARTEAFDAWWRLLSDSDKERLGRIYDGR